MVVVLESTASADGFCKMEDRGGFLFSVSIDINIFRHLFGDFSASSKEILENSVRFPPGLYNNWSTEVFL